MNIKILVAYHKKAPLYKNEVLVPIHVGRAVAKEKSKDGVISNNDLKWLQDNMIGDDTGDNISELNREVNEWTGLYWAWKNYDKLGNPDYIGLCHDRCFFELPCLFKRFFSHFLCQQGYSEKNMVHLLEEYDFICVKPEHASTNKDITFEGWQKVVQLSENYHPLLYKEYLRFKKDQNFYNCNMFLMKKEDFFNMCQECMPIMFDLIKKSKEDFVEAVFGRNSDLVKQHDGWYPRSIGYAMEYISCFYFMHLMNKRKTLYVEKKDFKRKSFVQKICSLENERWEGHKIKVLTILGVRIIVKKEEK